MKVLVDTSVWSLALRRKRGSTDSAAIQLSELIAAGQPIYLIGVILQEILQGVRNNEQFTKLRQHLEPFPLIEPGRDDYVAAAQLSSLCCSNGVQAGTIDYLIAAVAIGHECHLLTTDQDFVHIGKVAPLKLL